MTTPDASDSTMNVDSGILREADHDRDLNAPNALVTDISRPTEHVLRLSARLSPDADSPNWTRPNTAIRIALGAEFGDVSRVYTVRDFDPAARLMTVDIVLHDNPSPMMRWVAALRPGDSFRLTGPRPHFLIPDMPDRPVALFLDETAIPALYSILGQWPAGKTGIGWVSTVDVAAFAELPSVEGLTLHRVEPGAGAARYPLAECARALVDAQNYIVWGAGERDEMRDIRRRFRTELGLAKDEVAVFGYWKRGLSNTQIDEGRIRNYQSLLAQGGALDDFDDLAIDV